MPLSPHLASRFIDFVCRFVCGRRRPKQPRVGKRPPQGPDKPDKCPPRALFWWQKHVASSQMQHLPGPAAQGPPHLEHLPPSVDAGQEALLP